MTGHHATDRQGVVHHGAGHQRADHHGVDSRGVDPHHVSGGPILVDVGGATGALVLMAAPHHDGLEIEISPIEEPERRSHVAVHRRDLGGRSAYAAVYPALLWGRYVLWSPDGEPTLEVSIAGGRITEADWPG